MGTTVHQPRPDEKDGLHAAGTVVLHLTGQKGLRTVLRSSHVFGPVLVQDATATGSPAQLSHEIVVRHSKEPGRRIVGQASHGPRLECGHQRGLNGVLNRLEVLHSYPAREHRDQPAVLVPEEVLNEAGCAQGV